MKKISNIKFFFLIFLFLSAPFIQFFQTNSFEIAFYSLDILKIFLLIFFSYLFLFLILRKKDLLIIFSFFFFIIFQFAFLNLILNELFSLITIFLSLLIFTKYFIKKDLVINFFVIFLSLNLLFFLFNFFLNNNSNLDKFVKIDESIGIEEKLITNPKNIYLVVPDEMISIKHFEDAYNLNLKNEYRNNFLALGAKYLDGTTSNVQETALNFINILQLSEVKINKNYKEYHSLIKYYFNNPDKSKLLNFLYKNNYEFKLVGSPFMDCNIFDKDICLESRKKNLLNFYVLNTFLSASPYSFLREHIKKFLKEKYSNTLSSRYRKLYYENDSIGKFMDYSIDFSNLKKPHFFLIHHLSPHDPHFFNEDCSFRDKILDPNWIITKDYVDGYKAAYYCTLKKITKLIEYIKLNDKDGIIIVQSDTGVNQNGILSNYYPILNNNNIEIFSLVKSGNNCQKKIPNNATNIKIIELMIKCNFDL